MPVVSDFEIIQRDEARRIGDGAILWEINFNTNGIFLATPTFLMMMVKGLTYATDGVDVKVNNRTVGQIFPHRWPTRELREADAEHWYSESISLRGGLVRDGTNELQIEAIDFPGATGGNLFDDFFVRNVVIFYKQDV